MKLRTSTIAAALMLAGSLGAGVTAQSEFANNLKYDSGQDVQPVFEGWARVPNGTFDLYFGYLNRNWVAAAARPGWPGEQHPAWRPRSRSADVLLHAYAAQGVHG